MGRCVTRAPRAAGGEREAASSWHSNLKSRAAKTFVVRLQILYPGLVLDSPDDLEISCILDHESTTLSISASKHTPRCPTPEMTTEMEGKLPHHLKLTFVRRRKPTLPCSPPCIANTMETAAPQPTTTTSQSTTQRSQSHTPAMTKTPPWATPTQPRTQTS